MKKKYLLILSIILISFYSCSTIIIKCIGIKKQKEFSLLRQENFIQKYDIKLQSSFYVDKQYKKYLKSIYKSDSLLLKHFVQPLQVMYFINDTLNSHHINCNTGGFPNLRWNRNKDFNTFIPHKQTHTKLDLGFLFSHLKIYLKPTNKKQNLFLNNQAKIKIVVFWNFYLERQSKRLIKLIKKNINLNKNKENVEIYFVNNDKLYIE